MQEQKRWRRCLPPLLWLLVQHLQVQPARKGMPQMLTGTHILQLCCSASVTGSNPEAVPLT